MTNPVDKPPSESTQSPSEKETARKRKRSLRRRTFQFVIVFMVSVFVLLAGYESAKNSPQNEWYLWQVANSTAFLLKWVGYSCTVGNAQQCAGKEADVRAALAAWARGEQPPAVPPNDISRAPITAWEAYEYQLGEYRQTLRDAEAEVSRLEQDPNLHEPERSSAIQAARVKVVEIKSRGDLGPYIAFVLRAGLPRQLADQKAQLQAVKYDAALSDDARKAETDKIQARIDRLGKEMAAAKANPAAEHKARSDMAFHFIVIPDCGAVQSMVIFFAAVLAFPSVKWWKRVLGTVLGVALLYWVNAFRLMFLAIIGAWDNGGPIFKFAHEYVWQGIYIVFVVAIWMAWVELVVRRRA